MTDQIVEQTLKVEKIRQDFPILNRKIKPGVPLVYFDSAATSQKPLAVIEAMDQYYRNTNANIHRGVYTLAEEATAEYEQARQWVADFIGAGSTREVIVTRGTTESINLVAYSWARHFLKAGDLVVLTEMEHHSNLVPWQILAKERGVRLEFVNMTPDGLLDLDTYHQLLAQEPKLVAFVQASNVLGTINPARQMIEAAHQAGAITLVDGAQSTPHFPVNVVDLGADFFAFSGHKMCGPTGIGILYGREHLLEAMPPFMGGGDMILKVELRNFTHNDLPYKFEAGTPSIAELIGFGAAVNYLKSIGMDVIAAHEKEIVTYAYQRLGAIDGIKIMGPAPEYRGGVLALTMEGIHPHDVAQMLDRDGIAVRAGHHCAMPLHRKFDVPASTRASFYLYNTLEEVDKLADSLVKIKGIFS